MEDDEVEPVDELFLRRLLVSPPIDSDHRDPPPDSILLDPFGFISSRENNTTAEGKTRDGRTIRVSFWPAKPPRVSCFTVHCPDLPNEAFGDFPKIVTSEADLVLLRVPICRRGDHQYRENSDYFVYKVGKMGPSLDLIPRDPEPLPNFTDSNVVLLRCRSRNMYFIAKLGNWEFRGDGKQYNMYLYNSKKRSWSTKLMYASKDFNYCYPTKVITIGGPLGSVGWVDLWRGILICDLQQEGSQLRYIPLPSLTVPKEPEGPPTYIRDIIVVQGKIKYFDMHTYIKVDPESFCCVFDGWVAVTSERDPNKAYKNWNGHCRMEISEVTVTDLTCVQMLPNQQGEDDTVTILKKLDAGCPSLSLQHDGVVYITNKLEFHDPEAWVIAVDMKRKTLHDVAYYHVSGRRLSYGSAFFESGITKHLALWYATRHGHTAAVTRKNRVAYAGKK